MKFTKHSVLILCLAVFTGCKTEDILDTSETETICYEDTFSIQLNADDCKVDIEQELASSSLYQEELSINRVINTNNIPNHRVGQFPNSGNPNTIGEIASTFEVFSEPEKSSSITTAMGYTFGVLFSGVTIDPFTAEFFIQENGQQNRDWNITTLTNAVNLGLDCNNGHVQPTGKYHYHGTPSAYLQNLDTGGSEMIKVGFAADGFPIYYKYAEINGQIEPLESGYVLKEGVRPGDGKSSPEGCYDGTYFQDYEYVNGLSVLDECNGMTGKTPEEEEEYFYVITDNFPSSPLCFSGIPDASFRNGPGGPPPSGIQGHHVIISD